MNNLPLTVILSEKDLETLVGQAVLNVFVNTVPQAFRPNVKTYLESKDVDDMGDVPQVAFDIGALRLYEECPELQNGYEDPPEDMDELIERINLIGIKVGVDSAPWQDAADLEQALGSSDETSSQAEQDREIEAASSAAASTAASTAAVDATVALSDAARQQLDARASRDLKLYDLDGTELENNNKGYGYKIPLNKGKQGIAAADQGDVNALFWQKVTLLNVQKTAWGGNHDVMICGNCLGDFEDDKLKDFRDNISSVNANTEEEPSRKMATGGEFFVPPNTVHMYFMNTSPRIVKFVKVQIKGEDPANLEEIHKAEFLASDEIHLEDYKAVRFATWQS